MALSFPRLPAPPGPALVVISPTHAVVYKGRTPGAVYEIKEPLSPEDVEAIRTTDLVFEESTK